VSEQPSAPPDPDAEPATLGDLRSLRRWTLVAGVWAVAATAIAAIALIAANEDDEPPPDRSGPRIARVQSQLDSRIDDLAQRIGELPQSSDVSNLDSRLKKIEASSGRAGERLNGLSDDLDALQGRVDELEDELATAGTETTTTP
jgi:septal ring factor EnvC (AmiA/AmiB activator)